MVDAGGDPVTVGSLLEVGSNGKETCEEVTKEKLISALLTEECWCTTKWNGLQGGQVPCNNTLGR